MAKRSSDAADEVPELKMKKEEVKSEEQSIEEELAMLEQFFVVDEEEEATNEDDGSNSNLVVKDEIVESKSSGDDGGSEDVEVKQEPAIAQQIGVVGRAPVSDGLLPPGVDASAAQQDQILSPLVSPHGYAGFSDVAFKQKNFCLAVADPNAPMGKVAPKTLPDEVLQEERRRLEERDSMELFLADLPPVLVNSMLWRLDHRRYLRGVYRIDRNNALLIFADKDECKLAYPGIKMNRLGGEIHLQIDRVGKRSGSIFRRKFPFDDVSTLPSKVNSLCLCIQGVLHGAPDILHKVNQLFPKSVTINYPMLKGRRGRPVFVYFQTHEDALAAFWDAKTAFLTKYPITVVFARLEPHSSTTPWPENTVEVEADSSVKTERIESRPKPDSTPRKQDHRHSRRDDKAGHSHERKRGDDHKRNDRDVGRLDRSSAVSKRSTEAKGAMCRECDRYKNQRNAAETQLSDATRNNRELEHRLLELERENDALKRDLGKQDKEQWLLRQSLDESLKRVTTAEAESRDIQKGNDELRDRFNFERENSKKKLEELDFELRRMEEYKRKVDDLEASHAKLRDYDWMDKEYNKLRNENKSLVAENQHLFEQTSALHKALAGKNAPFGDYLDANQQAIQYLAQSAQRYSEEVQQLRADRAKLMSGGRSERLDRPVTSTALDDAARKVAELQVSVAQVQSANRDLEQKLEMSQRLLNTISGHIQTFDQCCSEVADMFNKCPLTIQGGSLETLCRQTSQDGTEIAAKARLLRGSLRDLLAYMRTLQGRVDSGSRHRDPRLDHASSGSSSSGYKDKQREKDLKAMQDILASKEQRIAQLELQIMMTSAPPALR